MRTIDGDELLDEICRDQCERKYKDCDGTCEIAAYVVNAPTIGGWISVKDRLPNHDNRVPVAYRFTDDPGDLHTGWMWYVREPFCGDGPPHWERFGDLETEVLYWYELPEIPKEART